MLFPLIESSLPEELLRIWQRSPSFTDDFTKFSKLSNLMEFIKREVEGEERIALALEGFEISRAEYSKKNRKLSEAAAATASGLLNNCSSTKCTFCDGAHQSVNCFKAQNWTLEQKRQKLLDKKGCFRCTKIGHNRRYCREQLRCILCDNPHLVIMCPNLNAERQKNTAEKTSINKFSSKSKHSPDPTKTESLSNLGSTAVFLQTLRVNLHSESGMQEVRALYDSGSQRSYILTSTARQLKYAIKGSEKVVHTLFGGRQSAEQKHNCYEVKVSSLKGDYSCKFDTLDQPVICQTLMPVYSGIWTRELEEHGIEISDTKENEPIQLLIGADVMGRLLSGKRYVLKCGLVAVKTMLGWILMGKIPDCDVRSSRSTTMTVTSLLSQSLSVKNLWELDVLGIQDPVTKRAKEEERKIIKNSFIQNTRINEEGRYEVRLPWVDGHPPLPSNEMVARKRLDTTIKKLINSGYYKGYEDVFEEWCNEGVIERIPEEELVNAGHYLPHRPVIRENHLTTKIRPVFDASASEKGSPSLNDCLDKGENLIELIPNVLIQFRKEKLGVIADIKKAFLQISLHERDRDFLRFFWESTKGEKLVYRHKRVVFGVNASPFLLGATLELHLNKCLSECESRDSSNRKENITRLKSSFYVDNCVTSVSSKRDLDLFIRDATDLMAKAKFDLRGWETSSDEGGKETAVLGLLWHKKEDTLSIDVKDPVLDTQKITKRVILSITQRVFDPIGYTCPATLRPKHLLQNLWKEKISWDEEVGESALVPFKKWVRELAELKKIRVSRWINMGTEESSDASLHTFCDASGVAFAAAVFLRVKVAGKVYVHLLSAKSRVAPLKRLSIPRLELLAASIGARLWEQVKKSLNLEVASYFWSDSTTVLAWIQRTEEWSVFVWNRVQEIRSLTEPKSWKHVPGDQNPADLLSRGCSPKGLVLSRWWEGPSWLYEEENSWPRGGFAVTEDEVGIERKKTVKTLICGESTSALHYFSKYKKIVRMVAWILRFCKNSRTKNGRIKGQLSPNEVSSAEIILMKLVQSEEFAGVEDPRISSLNVFKDECGLLRVRSRLLNREDSSEFVCPYLLPAQHPVVQKLVFDTHIASCHVGTQGLMNILRERFWVVGGRRAIRSIISSCQACKRHRVKKMEVPMPPLPVNRIRDALAFEIVGIDLAGPVFIREGHKVWICLITCAIYRAVHLDLVSSLSTHDFLQTLRRFIARRGRPKCIYTDNGTNFRGAENLLKKLNWNELQKSDFVERIEWYFSPPAAPWWGGWWERLIGLLKQLLKRSLGRACLNKEELYTILCDCEAVVNSRPLTYVSDDSSDLVPLTPAMFLHESRQFGIPRLDELDSTGLNRRLKYLTRLKKELRTRFRTEYLGFLRQVSKKLTHPNISVGDVVLVGNDNTKRIEWPLARVSELLPGRDGVTRLVRVQTAYGQLLRPVQRLYLLECAKGEEQLKDKLSPGDSAPNQTRSGRGIKKNKKILRMKN